MKFRKANLFIEFYKRFNLFETMGEVEHPRRCTANCSTANVILS